MRLEYSVEKECGVSAKAQARKLASLPYPGALRVCVRISRSNLVGDSETTKNFLFCCKSRCAFRNGFAQRAEMSELNSLSSVLRVIRGVLGRGSQRSAPFLVECALEESWLNSRGLLYISRFFSMFRGELGSFGS